MIHKIAGENEILIDDECDSFIRGTRIQAYSVLVDEVHDFLLGRLYGNAHFHIHYSLRCVIENRI